VYTHTRKRRKSIAYTALLTCTVRSTCAMHRSEQCYGCMRDVGPACRDKEDWYTCVGFFSSSCMPHCSLTNTLDLQVNGAKYMSTMVRIGNPIGVYDRTC
jgi:hypothetical protein